MDVAALVSKYPKVYHMADKRNWGNIQKHGLLSTTALLDLFEYAGEERFRIESKHRLKTIQITHPEHGEAFIRDQYPMRDRRCLQNCLVNMTPQEWFELLNRKTFFWGDTTGLGFMLRAQLYRGVSHYVFTVDTRALLDRHAAEVTICAFNSGSLYGKNAAKQRTRRTFASIAQHDTPWVTELAVEYAVPDILDVTVSVDECVSESDRRKQGYHRVRRIWPT